LTGQLSGHSALVTGGARGIGAAVATALANAGASIMIADILEERGRETAAALSQSGAKSGFVKLDVTDEEQWTAAVETTVAKHGGFDILINNAGVEITSLVVDL
jgi:3alpha(or 20beta)-hydroxysteroid dehydrogenase